MNNKKSYKIDLSLAILMIAIIISFVGCSNQAKQLGEVYGTEVQGDEVTEIRDILTNSSNYLNKSVKLEGKIVRQCPTGCWFYLEDNSGTIFVDIDPSGLTLPPKVGARAVVGGTVINKNGRTSVVGKGVEF